MFPGSAGGEEYSEYGGKQRKGGGRLQKVTENPSGISRQVEESIESIEEGPEKMERNYQKKHHKKMEGIHRGLQNMKRSF